MQRLGVLADVGLRVHDLPDASGVVHRPLSESKGAEMNRRSGFTLVELLVVITILLILSSLVWATFSMRSSDKMRSAARIAQSAFLGAKDRALHAKDIRGIRFIHDTTNPEFITGFIYTQPMPIEQASGVSVVVNPSTQTARVYLPSGVGQVWNAQNSPATGNPNGLWNGMVAVRLPGCPTGSGCAGFWFPLHKNASAPFWVNIDANGNYYLDIESRYAQDKFGNWFADGPAHLIDTAVLNTTLCDLNPGSEVLPFHQPVSLPSSCIIDTRFSGGGVPSLVSFAGTGSMELEFSPRGGISGPPSGFGLMHFLLRDLADATAGLNPTVIADVNKIRGDMLVLTVFPETGLVQTFECDITDANGDGVVDDLFAFAKQAKSAGR